MEGSAVSVMAMLLDAHVVDRSLSPGPSSINSCQAHARACPRSQEENGGEGIAAWSSSWGVISCFLSLSLSVFLVSTRAL